jgi:4-amino-4-deoxy-L-arabinose transferase-like glycosyltransferase
LGQVPLRDWDEGTIATVAKEMVGSGNWLYPTLYGAPYLNKPPLVEWLMSLSYQLGGIHEWTARLLPAAISALAVPLLYGVGRELFSRRAPALFSALVYLTLLPVVRHGRLAMRDGLAVSLFLALLLCLLKARQDRRWALGCGLCLGALSLTKGILALLLGGIAGLFLIVNQQFRLLRSGALWIGLGVGMLPAIGWYLAQLQHYGMLFWQGHFLSQSFERVWTSVDDHQGPISYYLLELLKYSWPWLLFWPGGLALAWRDRQRAWGQLVLIGTSVYLGTISVMSTKLPWYILPLYPFVALAIGAYLGMIRQRQAAFPRLIGGILGVVAIASLGGGTYLGLADRQPLLLAIAIVLSATLGSSAWQIFQSDRRFIWTLASGLYLSLLLLMTSPLWLWELNEAYPVKPVAELVRTQVPATAPVYTTFAYQRPSLDFYSDRHILPLTGDDRQAHWTANTYFLIEQPHLQALNLPPFDTLGGTEGWVLIRPRMP